MCTLDSICTVCNGRGIIWKGSEAISPKCWRCGGTGKWQPRRERATEVRS